MATVADDTVASLVQTLMNFVRKSLNSLEKLQQMFRIAEIELGMVNTVGITLETCVGVQSAILHVCQQVPDLGGQNVGRLCEVLLNPTHSSRKSRCSLVVTAPVTSKLVFPWEQARWYDL